MLAAVLEFSTEAFPFAFARQSRGIFVSQELVRNRKEEETKPEHDLARPRFLLIVSSPFSLARSRPNE